ncbi:MAG: isochorismatase family protein [Bacteroidetes bacterium]|jgi:protein-tyrosine phosphatase/nicotinamidase-related amidase|nr:isochorismatase family protein [Bacteroidota bacterium]
MDAILITQCLQNDFVQPLEKYDPLPNSLHVGYREALRLVGERPADGPVSLLMRWANEQEDLKIIHIRDWHDANDPAQQEHLKQFGNHCLQNTKGADFIFSNYIEQSGGAAIVNASGLNDFYNTTLEKELSGFEAKKVRVGVLGVWTEAKISYLLYELRTRYPDFELAVCSALTASSSTNMHFIALDQLKNILGVKVFQSVGDFTSFLNGTTPEIDAQANSRIDSGNFTFDNDTLSPDDKKLLNYLFRDASSASFKVLDGGFSGNVVLKASAVDQLGHRQVPTVVKMGDRSLISKERASFERIQEILGNNAPSIVDFAEEENRGAIKYRYAAMLDEKVTSFQNLYESGTPLNEVFDLLDIVFEKQLGRLYKAAKTEKLNLLKYYDFSSKYAGSVRKRIELLTGTPANGEVLLLEGHKIFNVCNFYEKDIDAIGEYVTQNHYMSYIHGDLNGANIIIDAQRNSWIIDFFHTHYGHVIRDLVKIENDLLFIFTKINTKEEFEEAVKLIDCILAVEDLAVPPDPEDKLYFKFPQFRRALETVQKLRSFYPNLIQLDRIPYQYHVSLLRYSMHTLSFDECNDWQKKLALYCSSVLCSKVKNYLASSRKLRIDYIHQKEKELKGQSLIGMTILPGRKDRGRDLQKDIESIREQNIAAVVTLLSESEFAEYGVQDLRKAYKEAGIELMHQQVADQGITTLDEMKKITSFMDAQVNANKKILVHCVGGLGRTGTAVACYLKEYAGLNTADAIEVVRESRSPRAIENERQENFVNLYL